MNSHRPLSHGHHHGAPLQSTAMIERSGGVSVVVNPRFEADKQAWEDAIRGYNGNDPLDLWFNYITWYEQNRSFDRTNNLRSIVEKCLLLYQDTEGYKQDTRMVKIWMKYTNMQQSPASFYQMMYKKNIGTQCASFYIGWAESAYKQAESIYNLGIQMKAQPIEELHEAQRNYRLYNESLAKKRSASTMVEQRQPIPSQSPPQKRLKQELGNYQLQTGTNGAVIHHDVPNGTFVNQQQQQQHPSHAYYHQQKASGSYYLPENAANGGTYYTSNGQEEPYQSTNSFASTESGPSTVPVTSSASASASTSHAQQSGQHQALSGEVNYHAAASNGDSLQQQELPHRTEAEPRETEYQPTDESIIECNLNNSAYVISSSLSYVYDDSDLVQYPVAEEIPRPAPEDATESVPDRPTSQEPTYESDAIRLPPNFAREAKSNHETWDVPLCLEEPYDPNRQCCYPKHLVYPDLHAERPTMEFSLEEIRAQRWLERKRQHEKQKKMQEEEEEAQRQAKAAQLEKEKQMRQMQQMKYQQQQQQQQQRMYNVQQYSSNASGHMPIGQTMQTQPNNSYHSQPQQMRQGSIQHTSNFYHQQQQQPYHGYSNGCYTASSPQMQQSHHSYQPANVSAATVIQNHNHHHQHQQQHLLHHQQQQTHHHHHHQQQHHSPVPTSHMHSPNTVATPYGQHGQQQHHYAPVNHHHGNLHSPQPYHIPYENYNQHNSYPAGHQPGQQPQHQQQQEVTTPQRTYQSMTNVVSPYGYGSPVQQEAIAPRPGNAHYAMAPQTPPNHQIYPQSPGHQHTHHGHHHQQQHPQLGMVGVSPQSQSNRGHSVLQQSPHQEHPYNHHQQQQHPHHSHHHSQYTTAHYNTNEQQDTKLHTGYAQNCTPDSAKLNPSQHNYKEHGGPAAMTEPSETQPPVNGGTASGSYINNAQERQDRGVEHQVQQNNNHGKYNNANNNCDDFEEQIEASTIRFSTPTENGISRKQTITIKFKKEKTGLSLAVDSPSSPAATGTVGESSGSATTALLDQHNEQQQVLASASSAVPVEEKSKKHKKHTQQQRMSETGMGKSSSSAKGKHSRKKQASLSQAPDEHHMDDANLLLSFSRPEKDEDSCLSVQSQTDASSVGSKKKKKSKRSKSGTSSKEKRRRHRYDLDEDYRVEDEEEADEDQGGDGRAQNGVMRRERVLDDEYSEATVGGYEEDDDGVEDQYYEVEEEEDEQVNGEVEENDEEEEEEEEDDDEEEYYEEEETSRETTQRRRTIGGDRRAATKRIIRPDEDDSSYQSNSEFNTSFSNISFAGDNSNGPFNFGGSNCSTPARRTQTSGGVGGGGAFSKTSTPVGSFRYLRKQETNLSTLGQNDDSMNSTVVESSFFQAGEHDEEGRRRRLEKALGTIETHLGRPFVDPFNSELCRAFLTKVDFPSRNRDPADNYHLSNANLPKLLKGQTVNLGGTGYSIEKEVGRGSYGSVFRANNTQTSAVVAIKYQKPANTWELYICTEVKKRLTNLKMLPGFMDISAAVIAPNASVLVSEFSQYGSLLDINNKIRTAATRKVMHESLVMHFSCQILSIVEHLHACNIIHADIKPDNFLLMKIPSRDLEEPTLRLIDFGCAIDMNFFEPKRQFKKVIQTDGFTCIEMQEGRPWSYQTDLFCVAGTIHVMLFGEYMQLVKKYESGWDIKQKLPRYLKKHVWTEVFQKLLNIKDIDHMPSLPDLRRLIYEEAYKMDSELTTHIRSLSNLLKSR